MTSSSMFIGLALASIVFLSALLITAGLMMRKQWDKLPPRPPAEPPEHPPRPRGPRR